MSRRSRFTSSDPRGVGCFFVLGSGVLPRAPPRAWSWGSLSSCPRPRRRSSSLPSRCPGWQRRPRRALADGAGLLDPLPPRRRAPRLGREAAPRDAVPGQPHAHGRRPQRPSAVSATWPAPRRATPPTWAAATTSPTSPRAARARCRAPAPPAGAAVSARSSPGAAGRSRARAPRCNAWLNSPPHRAILLGNGAPRRRRGQAHRRLRRPRLLGDGRRLDAKPVSLLPSGGLGRARLPGEAADRQRQADHRPHAEHEQRDEVVAGALAVDHRARQPVDQVLERQHLGDVARSPPGAFSRRRRRRRSGSSAGRPR